MGYEQFWAAVTTLGDVRLWILLLFFAASYIYIDNAQGKAARRSRIKKWLWVTFFAMVIAGLSVQALKNVIDAPRICDPATNPYCYENGAFPSGHTAIAFAMFAVIPLAGGRRKNWAVMVLPVLVGYSRLALGVHTLADVVAGAILGMASAFAGYKLYEFGKARSGRGKGSGAHSSPRMESPPTAI